MSQPLIRPENRSGRWRTESADRKSARDAWLGRPAGMPVALTLLCLTLAAPYWLLADQIPYFKLAGDDFAYISESRTLSITISNLMTPHNTHVIPLFRLWTYALVASAGRLANLPAVFGAASYLGLVATMLAVARFVREESRNTALCLATMAFLGISSVLDSVATWYSAGQALWAGAAIVLTLILAQGWSARGGAWRFGLVILGMVAAPAIWSGGQAAGPAAAAYLWASGRAGSRRAALALIGIAASLMVFELILVRDEIRAPTIIWEKHPGLLPRPIQAVLHSTQAISEVMLFANLGLDAITTPLQSVAITLGLAGLWAWSRGNGNRPNPLEAAGATIVLVSYLMVYVFRGNLPFSSLREVGWYHAIPQVGAALFAAGWWQALMPSREKGDRTPRFTRKEALIVFGLVLLQCLMQRPRADRMLLAKAPPLTGSEARKMPIQGLQKLRARYFLEESRDRQVRHLARLDSAEGVAARNGLGPESIRRMFGRVLMPGIPELQVQTDVVAIMSLPRDAGVSAPTPLRPTLERLLLPEPEPRPSWLDPEDPWPPKR